MCQIVQRLAAICSRHGRQSLRKINKRNDKGRVGLRELMDGSARSSNFGKSMCAQRTLLLLY
jgi:hypothetical protein